MTSCGAGSFVACYYGVLMESPPSKNYASITLVALLVAALAVGTYSGMRYHSVDAELASTTRALTIERTLNTAKIADLEASTTALSALLASSSEERIELYHRLGIAIEDNSSLSHQISMTQGQIEVLNKLRATDKELLQKYSKVFFLNENYIPSALASVTPTFVWDKKKSLRIHSDVQPFLEKMMRDAALKAHPLLLVSAYRSFSDQTVLKSSYSMSFGNGANKFSADQGYSEHQLGTTVDFTSPSLGASYTSFAGSDSYQWLLDNAYKYGFVLSYPKNNSYYVFEPWHWRFVGIVLSAKLHQEGKNFYDLEQRDIDQYLIDIFELKDTMQ